jgi:GxxExxY protein
VELKAASIFFEQQKVYSLEYKGVDIGGYIADIVVDNAVIIELKSVAKLNEVMDAQLINYLKLSKLAVGYLLNFHSIKVEWERLVNSGSG